MWDNTNMVKILERYNPCTTEYDEEGEIVWDIKHAPVIYDLYEQFGSLLCASASLGWVYVCKCATAKIAQFINKNWLKHLLAVKYIIPTQVSFLL